MWSPGPPGLTTRRDKAQGTQRPLCPVLLGCAWLGALIAARGRAPSSSPQHSCRIRDSCGPLMSAAGMCKPLAAPLDAHCVSRGGRGSGTSPLVAARSAAGPRGLPSPHKQQHCTPCVISPRAEICVCLDPRGCPRNVQADVRQVWYRVTISYYQNDNGRQWVGGTRKTELTVLRSRGKEMGSAETRRVRAHKSTGEVAQRVRQLLTERASRAQTQTH